MGIVLLRFLAGLFVRWLQEYKHLENAGYLAATVVGLRLLCRVVAPELVPPQWAMVSFIGVLFVWGFSRRNQCPPQISSQIASQNASKLGEISYELVE